MEEYWKKRCELAENYIEKCPCDPDIYEEQSKAFWEWQDFINRDCSTCKHDRSGNEHCSACNYMLSEWEKK